MSKDVYVCAVTKHTMHTHSHIGIIKDLKITINQSCDIQIMNKQTKQNREQSLISKSHHKSRVIGVGTGTT